MSEMGGPRITHVGWISENGEPIGWTVEGGTIDMWPISDLRVLADVQENMGEHDAERVAVMFTPHQ